MKKFNSLVISFVFLISTATFGVEPVMYKEVVHVNNVSQEELYYRAKFWFVNYYSAASDVLQIENKEKGLLVGKGYILYEGMSILNMGNTEGNISYTINVFLREGRYLYEITNFVHEASNSNENPISMGLITTAKESPNPTIIFRKKYNMHWNSIKKHIDENVALKISSLNEAMQKSIAPQLDEW